MHDEGLEREIASWLTERGIVARQIPRSDVPTADLEAEDGMERYVIEIKHKQAFARDESTVGVKISLNHWIEPTGYRNRFSGLLRSAVKQMSGSIAADGKDPLRVIWCQLDPPEDRLHENQLSATLYGKKFAVFMAGDRGGAKYCINATRSEFYRHREKLDGVVVCGSFGIGLLLNHHSSRYERLKRSRLAAALRTVYDPPAVGQRGDIFVITPCQSESDKQHTRRELRRLYNVDLRDLTDLTHYRAEVSVPKK